MNHCDVLVVDDHADIRTLIRRILSHEGYTVECADSGRPAIEFLLGHRVGVVILDFMMPGMDGIEVLRRIRETPQIAAVPVIINTAVDDSRVQAYALSRGANGFIVKGALDLDEL